MAERPTSVVLINQLLLTEPIVQGIGSDGELTLRPNIYMSSGSGSGYHLLRDRLLVALALTEMCCRNGKGKIFYLPMAEEIPQNRRHDDSTKLCVRAFFRLPKLIYVPWVWSKREQAMWWETGHQDRLAMLNARGGGIKSKENVMPMDLAYDPVERETFNLTGFVDKDSGCKAIIAIVPKVYLGWYNELRATQITFNIGGDSMDDIKGGWAVTNDEILCDYQLHTIEAIVEKLWAMYFAGEPRSLVQFDSVLRGVIGFEDVYSSIA